MTAKDEGRKMARALLIHNGPMLTMDQARPEVEAIAFAHGIVVAMGSVSEARAALPGLYDEIDLGVRFACPGLIDAHAHVMGVGWAALDLDLSSPPNESIGDLVELVAQAARSAPQGAWIQGRGYDQASL